MHKSLAVILLCCAATSHAAVIDMIGDADGFGIGATAGSPFEWTDVGLGDGDGTDVWRFGDYTYSHIYDVSGLGTIATGSLEIFTGGQGLSQLTTVYIDNVMVGQLTDGDDAGPPGYNYATLDIFDLTPYASLLDGANEIRVDVFSSGDGWVLDYSKLSVSAVPIPAAVWLFGSALAGLGWLKRKQTV